MISGASMGLGLRLGDEKPVKTCPACLQEDIPEGASKCRYCGTEQLPVRVG
ncbi:hypothetical protein ABT026_22870 [Streptomyces sp. NPDC002734]|uniref:hypothetical protein n=1 Tax=Streptomyces sp. NPDC002734 TaxID=3154426 RepID=UPI00331EAAF5